MEQQTYPQTQANGSNAHQHPHYNVHGNPQFYGSGHKHDTGTLTPEQNAESLAKYQREHAEQLARNLASHGGHSETHYHPHSNPQFYGSGHKNDTGTLTPEQNAESLAKYQREHAAQLAKNLASHGGHPEGHHEQKSSSGRSTPRFHQHKNPSFYGSGHTHDGPPVTAEQNAENLAKYQREHAALLAKNLQSHGGHAEGDEYSPSKAAHHHPHFHYHLHQAPQFYAASHVADDKPKSGVSTPK